GALTQTAPELFQRCGLQIHQQHLRSFPNEQLGGGGSDASGGSGDDGDFTVQLRHASTLPGLKTTPGSGSDRVRRRGSSTFRKASLVPAIAERSFAATTSWWGALVGFGVQKLRRRWWARALCAPARVPH